ncbi:MAG: helix-turn-helix domain-containing protein [Candidatus Peregrinibacteria bacterium]
MLKDANYHVLINLGLDDKEARIYLALLELGQASILQIAKTSKVNRASIYYIIEKMKRRGYVTPLKTGGKDIYMAVRPELLLAQEKKHVQDFESVVPELTGLINQTGQRPVVRFYEGIEAVKAIYADTLTAKTEILNYANSREVRRHWTEYDQEYVARRIAKNIYLRGIAPNDEYGRQVKAGDRRSLRKIRLIDPKKLNFTDEINIYDNKIAMVSFGEEVFGVIIESQAMADTQRSIFEMAWRFAAKH